MAELLQSDQSMKDAFVKAVTALGDEPDFIYLDADLMRSIGTYDWAVTHPGQAVNLGVAEANMIGVAAGLAFAGWRPLAHSFAAFASRRCFDQVFLSAGYARLPLTVVGSDPGVTAAYNGGTHMPFEDLALYRAIPEASVTDISTPLMLQALLPQLWRQPGVKYIRFGRRSDFECYGEDTAFLPGRSIVLEDGEDAAILASGILVAEALQASHQLRAEGLSVAVVDLFSIKPLDRAAVLRYAARTGALVSAENHNVIGGLGSAVADVLAREHPCVLEMIGVQDAFGQVGSQAELQALFGLTAEALILAVRRAINRKKGM